MNRAVVFAVAVVLGMGSIERTRADGCILVRWYGPQWSTSAGCGTEAGRLGADNETFSCDTGLPAGCGPGNGFTPAEFEAQTGVTWGPYPGCHPHILVGPFVAHKCSDAEPRECKAGVASSDARMNGAGLIGDPVDLATAQLSLDPVDVNLGHGLRFARHYSSGATLQTSMGKSWSHSLDWRLVRATANGTFPILLVKEPLRAPIPFASDGTTFSTNLMHDGSVSVDGGGIVHYTSGTQVEADFDAQDRLIALRYPGEPQIDVTYATDSATYSNGTQSIVITRYPPGHANAGLVSSVTANGEVWSYGYSATQHLTSVVGPDPSTATASDTTTWTYVYSGATNRITRVDRTSSAGTTTLGSWAFNSNGRVTSADEQALEQPLLFSYSTPQSGTFRATVKNSSNQTLALFDSVGGATTSITNPSGPAAPVAGGPGVPVPFGAATTISANNRLTRTQVDQNGNVTLYENYDGNGHPGRIVEGWVDGPILTGVFSGDDTFASLTELTWHPVLQEHLVESSPSVLPGGGTRTTIFDYDDPAALGDNPALPNEAPTNRLYSRTDQGYTLDSTGAVVLASYETTFTYDAAGRALTESGPRPENFTQHLYDAVTGYRTATRRYLNGAGSGFLETTFSNFDSLGNPQTITDPNGRATLYTYDTIGRVKTVTPPFTGASSTITFTYDVDGNLTRIDFPPDSFAQPYFLRFGYDTKNRLTFLADAAGSAIVYERTSGRVTREALYAGFIDLSNRGTLTGDSTFSYDVAGRLLKAFNPLFAGNTVFTQYGSDANSNPTSITDENGKQDTRLYDALDRLTQVSQVRSGGTYVTQFGYDGNGRVKIVTDPAGKTTDHQHDDFGRLVKVTSPNTGVTLYVYDAAGNLATKKENFTGTPRTTTYAYDGLDRLTLVDFATDADWAFTYDTSAALNQKGRLASVTNGIVTTEREYTDRGDLALERTTIGGASYSVTYGYDAGGNLTALQAPSGVTAGYGYSGGRPKTLTVTAGADQQIVRNISFAPFGGRTRAEFPPYDSGSGLNTVISTRTYNLRGQVATLQVTAPSGTVLDQSFDYAYTAGGVGPNDPGPNLDRVVDNRDPSESRFYFYDELDRLWKATDLAGTPLYTYLYDANGNRTQEVAPGGTTAYSYESATDRIAQESGAGAKYYAHDAYGSRIWAGPTAYAGLPSHVYNELNRLVEVRDPVTQAVLGLYTYDAFGRRVRKITASGTKLFFYDSAGQLLEERSLATTPHTVRDYAWIEEEPVGTVDTGPQPTRFAWVHTDRLGTPLAMTSSPGSGGAQTIWRASYAPFGLAFINGDPDGDLQQFGLDLRFPGQSYESEAELNYNFFRSYDATMGRYLEADPIGIAGALNSYSYVDGQPITFSDPLGLESQLALDFVLRRPAWAAADRELERTLDEMLGRNIIGADQFFHCLAACRAEKASGDPDYVRKRLDTKEYFRDYPKGRLGYYGDRRRRSHREMLDDIAADRSANERGLTCSPGEECRDRCEALIDAMDRFPESRKLLRKLFKQF